MDSLRRLVARLRAQPDRVLVAMGVVAALVVGAVLYSTGLIGSADTSTFVGRLPQLTAPPVRATAAPTSPPPSSPPPSSPPPSSPPPSSPPPSSPPPSAPPVPAPGAVWGMGANSDGQIGDGTLADKNLPTASLLSGGAAAISASSGGWVSLALKADGTVWAWGNQNLQNAVSTPAQLGVTGVKAIAAGRTASYLLKTDGTVSDRDGNPINGLSSITALAVSDGPGIALKSDGTVYNINDASAVGTLASIVAIAAGAEHYLALKSDGTVYAWGLDEFGQSGDASLVTVASPQQVPSLTGVVAIAAGSRQSMALKSDGTVVMWGQGTSGQLGNGSNNPINPAPVQVSGLSGVIAITSGRLHSVALKADGTVWAWGDNGLGQLGNGSYTNTNVPTQVTVPASQTAKVIAVAAARTHTILLFGPK